MFKKNYNNKKHLFQNKCLNKIFTHKSQKHITAEFYVSFSDTFLCIGPKLFLYWIGWSPVPPKDCLSSAGLTVHGTASRRPPTRTALITECPVDQTPFKESSTTPLYHHVLPWDELQNTAQTFGGSLCRGPHVTLF